MCLAIYKPADVSISEARLKSGWLGNSGGGGFCYVRKGQVKVFKEFLKWQDFLEAYNQHLAKNKKSPFLIHFRIPSMGDRSGKNTHPFTFAHGALIHNGTIYGTGAISGSGPSDTALFTARFGDRLTYDNVEDNKKQISEALGYNKIALLYHDGRHQILNEEDGHWVDGAWYSNNYSFSREERFGVST